MFTRTRFQAGSLTLEKRQRGASVWVFRWREKTPDGRNKRPKIVVGTREELKTESQAKHALAKLNINTNPEASQGCHPALLTMGQLLTHYNEHDLSSPRTMKSQTTVEVYRDFVKLWIRPRWAETRVSAVKPVEVEDWLHHLALANGTKAKLRNILSGIFQHGLRHQLVSANPIRGLVRQSAKRQREPDVLTANEIKAILLHLQPMHRCLVFLAASTGLRFSELRGLQWQDFDFGMGLSVLHLRRGVVRHHVTALKTAASRKPVPLDPALVDALTEFRSLTGYNQPGDWIFASVKSKGRVPVWPSGVLQDHILPVVQAAGIQKHVSWHTFRHSYATLLKANGEDVKTVQDSLSHATFAVTMDLYTQAIPANVREAHGRVVNQLAHSA